MFSCVCVCVLSDFNGHKTLAIIMSTHLSTHWYLLSIFHHHHVAVLCTFVSLAVCPFVCFYIFLFVLFKRAAGFIPVCICGYILIAFLFLPPSLCIIFWHTGSQQQHSVCF